MIIRPLERSTFYRMHTPRWATTPTSGAGAAKHGGRFNRVGTPALYLSATAPTAISEYQQDALLMPPGTLVAYTIQLSMVADFSGGFHSRTWDPLWEDWNCDWRRLAIAENIEPPSWILGDVARESGLKAVLFPSLKQAGGLNVALFTEMLDKHDVLVPYDPHGDLPTTQASWLQ